MKITLTGTVYGKQGASNKEISFSCASSGKICVEVDGIKVFVERSEIVRAVEIIEESPRR